MRLGASGSGVIPDRRVFQNHSAFAKNVASWKSPRRVGIGLRCIDTVD